MSNASHAASAAASHGGDMTAIANAEGLLGLVGHWLEWVAVGIDLIGVAIILFGFIIAFIGLLACLSHGVGIRRSMHSLTDVRLQLGVYILVGLEFMIASDIIHTVITREPEGLIFVGALVTIRVAISFFLGRELSEARREELEIARRAE